MTSKRFEKFWADAFGSKLDWADLVNCTPHPITVMADLTEIEGAPDIREVFTIQPTGILPRVKVVEADHPAVRFFPFRVVTNTNGPVENLPDNDTGQRWFIVSRMVFEAAPERSDLLAPDTGPSAVRDESGRILGVTQFVAR